MFLLLLLAMRSLGAVAYMQRFERLPSREQIGFIPPGLVADNFAGLVGLNLHPHRSLLIQVVSEFSDLCLEAPVVHHITDFRQKPTDQGRIFF